MFSALQHVLSTFAIVWRMFMEKFATSNVQIPAKPGGTALAPSAAVRIGVINWGFLWCGCTSGKQWSYLFPAVCLTWIKDQFAPEHGCCWLQHRNCRSFIAKRVAFTRLRDLKANGQAVFKCNMLRFSQAHLCVLRAQSANPGYNSCIA